MSYFGKVRVRSFREGRDKFYINGDSSFSSQVEKQLQNI